MKELILILEDDPIDLIGLKKAIQTLPKQFDFKYLSCYRDAYAFLSTRKANYIVTDYYLGDGEGLKLIQDFPEIPTMLITGTGNIELAIKALNAGAEEVLEKDVQGYYLKLLPLYILRMVKNHHNNIEHRRLIRQNKILRAVGNI